MVTPPTCLTRRNCVFPASQCLGIEWHSYLVSNAPMTLCSCILCIYRGQLDSPPKKNAHLSLLHDTNLALHPCSTAAPCVQFHRTSHGKERQSGFCVHIQ